VVGRKEEVIFVGVAASVVALTSLVIIPWAASMIYSIA